MVVEDRTELPLKKNIEHLTKRVKELEYQLLGKKTIPIKSDHSQFKEFLEKLPNIAVQGYRGDGTVIYWNRASENVYGYASHEAIGKNLIDLIIPPEMRDEVTGVIERGFETGQMPPASELLLMKKDGTLTPVYSSHIIIKDENLEPILFCVDIDLKSLKKSEFERNNLLNILEEKNRELENIVHVASHDMRTPLVTISGFSRELKFSCDNILELFNNSEDEFRKEAKKILEEEIPEAVELICASSSKMGSLLDGLLRIARLGTAAMKIVHLDMNHMIDHIIKTVSFQVKKARVQIIYDNLPDCMGDSSQVNQVFSNIIDNALKHLEPSRPGKIIISGSKYSNHVIYRIRDNGIGLDEQNLDNIFKMFYRSNPDKLHGEGIGLAVVRRIINRHNGKVWAELNGDYGLSIFVQLPSVSIPD